MYGDQFGEFVCGYWGLKGWQLRPVYMDVGNLGEVTCLSGVTRLSTHNPSFYSDHVNMIGGVTHHMLLHLSGVPHPHVNRPSVKRITCVKAEESITGSIGVIPSTKYIN